MCVHQDPPPAKEDEVEVVFPNALVAALNGKKEFCRKEKNVYYSSKYCYLLPTEINRV